MGYSNCTNLQPGDAITVCARDPRKTGIHSHQGRFREYSRGGEYVKYDYSNIVWEFRLDEVTVDRRPDPRQLERAQLAAAAPLRPADLRTVDPLDGLALFDHGRQPDLF